VIERIRVWDGKQWQEKALRSAGTRSR
jgi:hypothetical protein